MLRFPLCLLLIYDLCLLVASFSMLGKADVIFKRMEQCEDELHVVEFWIAQKKVSRNSYNLDITVKNPYPIDDTVTLELKGWMKKEGGFKPGALYLKDAACKVLEKLMGELFLDILQRAGVETCPLPAGDHAILDYFIDNDKFNVPQLYGEYKVEVFLYKDDELQSCYVAFYDLVENLE